jgi:hypothetical protein
LVAGLAEVEAELRVTPGQQLQYALDVLDGTLVLVLEPREKNDAEVQDNGVHVEFGSILSPQVEIYLMNESLLSRAGNPYVHLNSERQPWYADRKASVPLLL